ncbi:MAG: endopeptidase La [Anaerolineae bacterium]
MDLLGVVKTKGQGLPGAASVDQDENRDLPDELPVLPLKNIVVFPLTVLPLIVQKPRSVRLVDDAVVADRMVALVALKDPEVEDPTPEDLYEYGTVATIHRLARSADDTLHIIVQGVERIRTIAYTQQEPYMRAQIVPVPEIVEDGVTIEAAMRTAADSFRRLVELASYLPDEMVSTALGSDDPKQLAYVIASLTRMDMATRQEILEMDSVTAKLKRLTEIVMREVAVLELSKQIQSDAQSTMEKGQREYFLREQLKAIQRELGEDDQQAKEIEELREKIASAGLPEEARKEALRELDRLSRLPAAAAEYSVIRTYLDWLTELPWQVVTEDNLDVSEARRVLDEDHYDLEEVKDRIVEFLAVRKLRQERADELLRGDGDSERDQIRREREGVILCFVGPPGVGKTSLGRSIARAMGREFIRQSLGGMHDEAEIRGHRRTYIGAMPGRILQAIRRVGSRNPVFMLDEVDKIGSDFRGDPASALLEVLDPEQNREFRDHYIDVPFDLSQVMFITTANVLDTIPAPLRDRMEILRLSGYTEEEKLNIARGYLIGRQLRENALRSDEVSFTDDALRRIVREYTREAGVREFERQIGAVCRKVATRVAEGSTGTVCIDAKDVPEYLGKRKYHFEAANRTQVPGVATGLAWTPAGGDILFVEATKMVGKGEFTITGQLGDVMKESATAALSYVRSKAEELYIDPEIFGKIDIHLHVPAGAIPKDGPSAGVTMATALASLLTGKPVCGDVAMTGELTLRGQVLPVGGIKEKVLAAHRSGLKTVCLPERNESDLDDLPGEVRDDIRFVLVSQVDQVFATAFGDDKDSDSDKKEIEGTVKYGRDDVEAG